MKRNPKQDGSVLHDCIPQTGPCKNNCNQCFYNRPGAFYVPIDRPHFPTPEEVGEGTVRVNSGHDSNIHRAHVIASTKCYPRRFFNTSIPAFNFPAPVVYTANSQEENSSDLPYSYSEAVLRQIMFVRLRVSSTNLLQVFEAAYKWSEACVPVVLTFMRYYEDPPDQENYDFRQSIINDYWCPKKEFVKRVIDIAQMLRSGAEITMCGTLESGYCRDCLNCERFYNRAMEIQSE